MILIKKPQEVAKMRHAGGVLARVMRQVSAETAPGVSTGELDQIADRLIVEAGCRPSFKGYRGYPAASCISVNEQVIHGIPNGRVLQEGDIVDLDFGVEYEGYHADAAWTFAVGGVSETAQRLMNVTRESLNQAMAKAAPGVTIGDIGHAVQKYVESNGFSVVRDLVGHGIGRDLHEEPAVPNFGKPGRGAKLRPGMTICIEPMVNEGTHRVDTLEDGWTIVTRDGKLSAHYEHTVLITEGGCEALTVES